MIVAGGGGGSGSHRGRGGGAGGVVVGTELIVLPPVSIQLLLEMVVQEVLAHLVITEELR